MLNEDIYITPSIIIRNNKTFFLDDTNKKTKITKRNWHKYLDEYGWGFLDDEWEKRLTPNNKYSCYGLLDCGGEGDCLFYCVIEALKEHGYPSMNVENLRNLVANEIDEDNFDIILETYKLEKESEEFDGLWNPFEIENIEDLRNQIRIPGDNFWGDHILLQLLEKSLNINIIILTTEDLMYEENNYKIQPRGTTLNPDFLTIFISYCFSSHFQLVGYYNGNIMKTKFLNSEIPEELKKIYRDDCGLEL
jgi:hypothetical protein